MTIACFTQTTYKSTVSGDPLPHPPEGIFCGKLIFRIFRRLGKATIIIIELFMTFGSECLTLLHFLRKDSLLADSISTVGSL